MSENINEAAHDETAAAGDAARRSSAEAAALTASSTPPEQQLHSGSASRLSPKVKGGIIALLAASVLLVSVGAFALTGGFGGQDGSPTQLSSQEAQTTEQGRVTATKVTGEAEASAESEAHSKAESDSSEQNGESGSAAGQNADSDSAANGNGGAVDSDTTAGGGSQPSASPSGDSESQTTGSYVAAIGGLAEKEHGGTSGWMYSVNGSTPMTACTNYVLSNGDVVVWYYVTG